MFDFAEETCPTEAPLYDINAGIIAGTKVATPTGWRVIEAVTVGDQVLTFDGGMQTVRAVNRQIVVVRLGDTHSEDWPLYVPAGALGNRADMMLLPHQPILIESDTAEEVFGDPFAMIPALSLEGFRGITKMTPPLRFEVISLVFDQDEVVFANIGALFYCPSQTDLLAGHQPAYDVLSVDLADVLVSALEFENAPIPAQMSAA